MLKCYFIVLYTYVSKGKLHSGIVGVTAMSYAEAYDKVCVDGVSVQHIHFGRKKI